MSLVFELKHFSGPLELLLHLIGNAKIDIKDIFVSQVTEQYLQIVQQSEEQNMDEASEFIQMAATLLLIKSRSLLPTEQITQEEEENPEELLIRQLEEYSRFQQIAAQMQNLEIADAKRFTKLPDEFPLPPPNYEIEGLTLAGLITAFVQVSARIPIEKADLEQPAMIVKDKHTVSKCMATILKKVRKGKHSFSELLSQKPSRNEIVTLFLALLELLKRGRLKVSQAGRGQEIVISHRQVLEDGHDE
jgi:segregation and condensation protein A